MTVKECFEGVLVELSKVNAPSLLLQDFNYFFNKAINQYINKRYNVYDISQQTTDDVRVLKSTAILKPTQCSSYGAITNSGEEAAMFGAGKIFGGTWEVNLPLDYLHLLNCICIFKVKSNYKCWNAGDYVKFSAKRLTADSWSVIINDFYNRPLPWRPYYYIHNVNKQSENPTNPFTSTKEGYLTKNSTGTDASTNYSESTSNLPRKIKLVDVIGEDNRNSDLVEKEAGWRYGNASPIRMEIRYGDDSSVFELQYVAIDYLKAPQLIRLTQEQVALTSDTSQIMEFPDYVCQEIINELKMLVMENTADPRLQTSIAVSKSIADPAQQQTPQPQAQAQA